MSTYKITVPGLEAVANERNTSIFSLLTLPEGVDKSTLIDNIIIESGSYESLYSDIPFLTHAIAIWGRKHYRTFDKWIKALQLEYNPIENYDRFESWSDSETSEKHTDDTNTGSTTSNGSSESNSTVNRSNTRQTTDNSTKEIKKAAFNSRGYENYETEEIEATGEIVDSGQDRETGTDTFTNRSNSSDDRDIDETGNKSSEHTGRVHGNIGVTTSQQMIESELELARFNIYTQITDLFISEFTIPVFN